MKYHPDTLANGMKVQIYTVTGKVLGNHIDKEVKLRSSGGGGWIGPYGGTINPTVVTSETNTKQTIWLSGEEGKEEEINIFSNDVTVREGQVISAYYARQENVDGLTLCGVLNHSTVKYQMLNKNSWDPINHKWNFMPPNHLVVIFLGLVIYGGWIAYELSKPGIAGMTVLNFIIAAIVGLLWEKGMTKSQKKHAVKIRNYFWDAMEEIIRTGKHVY